MISAYMGSPEIVLEELRQDRSWKKHILRAEAIVIVTDRSNRNRIKIEHDIYDESPERKRDGLFVLRVNPPRLSLTPIAEGVVLKQQTTTGETFKTHDTSKWFDLVLSPETSQYIRPWESVLVKDHHLRIVLHTADVVQVGSSIPEGGGQDLASKPEFTHNKDSREKPAAHIEVNRSMLSLPDAAVLVTPSKQKKLRNIVAETPASHKFIRAQSPLISPTRERASSFGSSFHSAMELDPPFASGNMEDSSIIKDESQSQANLVGNMSSPHNARLERNEATDEAAPPSPLNNFTVGGEYEVPTPSGNGAQEYEYEFPEVPPATVDNDANIHNHGLPAGPSPTSPSANKNAQLSNPHHETAIVPNSLQYPTTSNEVADSNSQLASAILEEDSYTTSRPPPTVENSGIGPRAQGTAQSDDFDSEADETESEDESAIVHKQSIGTINDSIDISLAFQSRNSPELDSIVPEPEDTIATNNKHDPVEFADRKSTDDVLRDIDNTTSTTTPAGSGQKRKFVGEKADAIEVEANMKENGDTESEEDAIRSFKKSKLAVEENIGSAGVNANTSKESFDNAVNATGIDPTIKTPGKRGRPRKIAANNASINAVPFAIQSPSANKTTNKVHLRSTPTASTDSISVKVNVSANHKHATNAIGYPPSASPADDIPSSSSSSRRSARLSSGPAVSSMGKPPRIAFSNSKITNQSSNMKFLFDHGAKEVKRPTITNFDILVVSKGELKKTPKLLLSLTIGKPIVTDDWVKDSVKAGTLLATTSFEPNDPHVQDIGTSRRLLFKNKSILVTPALKKSYGAGYKEIENILKAAGAKHVHCKPARDIDTSKAENLIVLAMDHGDTDGVSLMDKEITCYDKELLAASIMRGTLDLASDEFKIAAMPSSQGQKRKRGRPKKADT